MKRRSFIKSSILASTLGAVSAHSHSGVQSPVQRVAGARFKLSCNLYSFNSPLTKGEMTLESVFEFCARAGFDAVDPTGYYFPGYPKTPPDDYLYALKRKAFLSGLDISGTGVRNDFTDPDPARRSADVKMVKEWIEAAARLGAPVLRVFAGRGIPQGRTEDEVSNWVVEGLLRCAEHGKKFGVLIGLQNHNDFVRNSDQVLRLLRATNSDWLGLNLDIGSFRQRDAYEEIARVLPHAITCQIKESVYFGEKETKTDLVRLFRLFKEAGYRGYLPIETLGTGDPRTKVPVFLAEVRKALA